MTAAAPSVPGVFAALSFADGVGTHERARLLARAEAVARGLAVAGSGRPDTVVTTTDDLTGAAGPLTLACALSDGGRVDVARLGADPAADLRTASMLLAPAAFWVRRAGRVLVACDPLGISQVHLVEGEGWAACSTSALLLAALGGRGLREDALATFAVLGVHTGNDTPFVGVHTLGPREACTLAGGRAERTPLPASGWPATGPAGDPVAAGVTAVRTSVDAAVAGHDALHLELSGGLDSRLLLAGLREGPRRVTTMTAGAPGSADVRVARAVSERLGLDSDVVDVGGLDELTPADAWRLVRRAAIARDAGGNAVAEGVLEFIEDRSAQGPRLSGQNGEFARGFYYAAQPPWPTTTSWLVRALVRWRLTTNDAAEDALFSPGFRRAGWDRTVAEIERSLRGYGGSWLAATDELYLDLRMRRWVGPEHSAAARRHAVVAPFFHPAYLSWARAAGPADKRGSRLCAAVLERMDPELASLPLDGRPSPHDLARHDLAARAAALASSAGKIKAKVRQRVRASERPAVGAAVLAAKVHEHWRSEPQLLERVARLPFVEEGALDEVLGGRRSLGVASTSLLVDLTVGTEADWAEPA